MFPVLDKSLEKQKQKGKKDSMKKLLALLLAAAFSASLLVLPASAASSLQKNYFEENDIPVLQETPVELPLVYVIYEKANPDNYIVKNGTLTVDSCTSVPSSTTAGYQDVTLTVTAHLEYFYDVSEDIYYSYCIWSNTVHDYYSGRDFSFGNMDGDVRRDITTTIRLNGRNYKVSCSKNNEWIHYGWEETSSGDYEEYVECVSTLVFTVPNTYNGLVYGLWEEKQPIMGSISEPPSDEESYAEKSSEVQYFRFGASAEEDLLDVNTPIYFSNRRQGDVGLIYDYTITNYTNEAMRGYYALLTYSPEEGTFWLCGQFHTFDLDLAPGESVSGVLVSDMKDISRKRMCWLAFDSKSERDAFFRNDVFSHNTDNQYIIKQSNERNVAWLESLLGTKLR